MLISVSLLGLVNNKEYRLYFNASMSVSSVTESLFKTIRINVARITHLSMHSVSQSQETQNKQCGGTESSEFHF